MNPFVQRAMEIAVRYGQPAADAFIRQAQAAYAAMRNLPQSAPKGMTGPFAPTVVRNPTTGYAMQYPLQRGNPMSGKTIMEYSPAQVMGAKAAVALPVTAGAAGLAAMGSGPSEVRPPISLAEEPRPPIYSGREHEPDYGQMGGPDILQRALSMTARPAKEAAVPLPPRRPAEVAAPPPMPVRAAPEEPSSRSLWEEYNKSGSAADFIRADRAMREGRAEGGGIPMGMEGMRPAPMDIPMPDVPKQAGAGGRDAAINKALEIIHHLVIRGR